MIFFRSALWTTLALVALVLAGCSRSILREGDRIIFLGDSITALGNDPGGYVSIVRDTLTSRHPELGLKIIGAGISGNKVPDLQKRLQQDVLDHRPTFVFIIIGINDVWHSLEPIGGTPIAVYEAGLREIIGKLLEAGVQVFLCTPTVIGERHDGTNALDPMLEDYAAISRQVAADMRVTLVDLRQAFITYLQDHNPANDESGILTYDSVHLSPGGNRLVAGEVLRALGD